VNLGFVWEKVYQQLHLALVEHKKSSSESALGISFPQYGKMTFPLGCKLRIFAPTEEQLQQLNIRQWLNRLSDHSHCTSIKAVPTGIKLFAIFRRKQFYTNAHVVRLAKRRSKRKKESLKQALEYFSGFNYQESKLPYINMVSLSSSQNRFRLFIDRELLSQPSTGNFNCYGLSGIKYATVPCF